jgi:hypothetical protein
MKHASFVLGTFALLTVIACGNTKNKKARLTVSSSPIISEGHYKATFTPLNSHLVDDAVAGEALIKIAPDDVTVQVTARGVPSKIFHAQFIHEAKACPILSDDANKDGIIDAVETVAASGKILLPLDSNLNSQIEKDVVSFPLANSAGEYFYNQSVSTKDLLSELVNKNSFASDFFTKIDDRSLDFDGRQIVIYGVTNSISLPDGLPSLKQISPHASIPIACGTLVKFVPEVDNTNSTGQKD